MILGEENLKHFKIKANHTFAVILALLLSMLMLTACGTSEFGVTENTGKRMTITAENAEKDAFFMVGALEVEEEEQIVIASDLTKGSVRVEIVEAPEGESVEELTAADGDAILTANLKTTEGASGTVPAGSYLVKATCLERATGTVQIEVQPAS